MNIDEYEECTTQMLEYEARIDIAAVDVLPWNTETPVSNHLTAEGIEA